MFKALIFAHFDANYHEEEELAGLMTATPVKKRGEQK